jgi:hypothetical protein
MKDQRSPKTVSVRLARALVRQVRAMLHAWEYYGESAAEAEFRARYDHKQRQNPNVSFKAVPQRQTGVYRFRAWHIVEHKELSPDERTLLVWLIEHGTSDALEYAAQIEQARVVGRCRCGCPTIDLGIAGAKERTVGGSKILADFVGETLEGFRVGVLLHAREGKLSELEVYSLDREGIFSLPTIESLKPFG